VYEGTPHVHFSRTTLVSLVRPTDSVLEIGPFVRPVLRGPNVRYFDVLDKASLIQRAETYGDPTKGAVDIDFISPAGDLSVVEGSFDVIFSSHCIEHQPDLVSHLSQVSAKLQKGGRYLLVIPDKRYCFDHFIPESTIDAVLAAAAEQRTRHTVQSVIEHRAHTTHNDAARHWAGDHGAPVMASNPGRVAEAVAEYEAAQGAYVDVHAWQFTPQSFDSVISQLHSRKMSTLKVAQVHATPPGQFEFCAVLVKD
jgi:SAM-dependent methyltransferase